MKLLLTCTFIIAIAIDAISQQTQIKYSVNATPWPEVYGNHRALIIVDKPSQAVEIDFLWRRHDASPEKNRMLIINSETGKEIENVYRLSLTNERCNIVFGPVEAAGSYFFYYLPSVPASSGQGRERPSRGYALPESAPDSNWVVQHRLNNSSHKFQGVTRGTISEIQARTEFNSFYPMEVVATREETSAYIKKYPGDYLVIPEDRSFPVKMLDALPLRWMQRAPGGSFTGTAKRNEYYAFQLAIIASHSSLQDIKLVFSDLDDGTGDRILAKAFTCYNTDGIDINGKPFTLKVNVKEGMVQPLWVGIDIPGNAKPGQYKGSVTVKSLNHPDQEIILALTIDKEYIADRGDGETWRHSRLRWLNSTMGIDDEAVYPYTPMVVEGTRLSTLGHVVQINNSGLPENIKCWGNDLLAAPMQFVIEANNTHEVLIPGDLRFTGKKNGIVSWECSADNDRFTLTCTASMEFDGHLTYRFNVICKQNTIVQDIRLELPLRKENATYMMGMGRLGGLTPGHHISRWIKTEDSFWIGSMKAGIQCELRGGSYNGPLLNLYQPNLPSSSWARSYGGFRIDTKGDIVTASAYSGYRPMTPGQSQTFDFALLLTPVKKLDTKSQFATRYIHSTEPSPEQVVNGGKILHVHHATPYNPYINYPFIAQKEMRDYIDKWHKQELKVKIYYTVRELSNHLTEIWALRSLGNEILAPGNGGGDRWLREHLVNNYTPQWYAYLGNGNDDEAVLNMTESRWYNYYVEGLSWLIKNMDIDGLYLDDVSYDRRILKRMRNVMEKNKPMGCIIDLHSNNIFCLSPVNQYMEFFPYIDRTWFGEGFSYDIMPHDYWLIETSGLPFGLMNDILMQVGRNTHRGMLYGMTIRIENASALWNLWDKFGIGDSKMCGYWEHDPVVTTDNADVLATAYINKGKTLISVGSWVNDPVNVKMNIDWKRLGLNPAEVNIVAPEIKDYQKERSFKVDETIPIDANSDCILIISKK